MRNQEMDKRPLWGLILYLYLLLLDHCTSDSRTQYVGKRAVKYDGSWTARLAILVDRRFITIDTLCTRRTEALIACTSEVSRA